MINSNYFLLTFKFEIIIYNFQEIDNIEPIKIQYQSIGFEQQIILGKKQEIKIPGNFKKQGRSKGVASLIFRRRKTHNIPKKRV